MTHLDRDFDTEDERALAAALDDAASRHAPPANWEARVWARALRQQTAAPRSRAWMRRLVPAVAVAVLVGVSGVLGTALWRSRSALSTMQDRVADEKREVEQLRRDLAEAQVEARSARTENARLEALASVPPMCGPGTIDEHVAKHRAALRTGRVKREKTKAKSSASVSCNPSDPLCGL